MTPTTITEKVLQDVLYDDVMRPVLDPADPVANARRWAFLHHALEQLENAGLLLDPDDSGGPGPAAGGIVDPRPPLIGREVEELLVPLPPHTRLNPPDALQGVPTAPPPPAAGTETSQPVHEPPASSIGDNLRSLARDMTRDAHPHLPLTAAILLRLAGRVDQLQHDHDQTRAQHPSEALAAWEPPKCGNCGREREITDAYDYHPLQAYTGAPLGWYSGDDGQTCGHCLGILMGRPLPGPAVLKITTHQEAARA